MITIIDYDAGNLTSVKRALDYCGISCEITPDPERIRTAERLIFPGVGHAASAMETIKSRGIDKAISDALSQMVPIMGICLGTQIILSHSEEGDTTCLGLIDGETKQFTLTNPQLKIPHMGWNNISISKKHYLLKDVREGDEFYFVHSFYPTPSENDTEFACCEYEIEFCAAMGKANLFATQFHPEKSGEIGLQILRNFSTWNGTDAE